MATSSLSSSKRPLSPSPTVQSNLLNEFNTHLNESGDTILQELRDLNSNNVLYLGDKDIVSKCEFIFNMGANGWVLIRKGTTQAPVVLHLAGVFEVSPQDFFLTLDAKYSSNSLRRFDQATPNALFTPVQCNPRFSFSSNRFPSIITNIHAIEKIMVNKKGPDDVGIIVGTCGASIFLISYSKYVIYYLFFLRLIALSEKN